MKKILFVNLATLSLLASCGDKSSNNSPKPEGQEAKAIYGVWKFRKAVGSLNTVQISIFVRIKEGMFEIISQCETSKEKVRAVATSQASIEGNKVTILEEAKGETASGELNCRASITKTVFEYEINKEVLTFKKDGKTEQFDRVSLPAL